MDRRIFIGTLAGGLLATPLAAKAQPVGKVHHVGYLSELAGNLRAPATQGYRVEKDDAGAPQVR